MQSNNDSRINEILPTVNSNGKANLNQTRMGSFKMSKPQHSQQNQMRKTMFNGTKVDSSSFKPQSPNNQLTDFVGSNFEGNYDKDSLIGSSIGQAG